MHTKEKEVTKKEILDKVSFKERNKACFNCDLPDCSNKCSACKKVYYCSKKCQTDHWKEHKEICKMIKGL